jgi:NitT/TauT family transport system ATP-binding protein
MCKASAERERKASEVFRSDVYRRALAGAGLPMPGASLKVEGALAEPAAVGTHQGALTLGPDRFFDGAVFDPADIAGYLAGYRSRRKPA